MKETKSRTKNSIRNIISGFINKAIMLLFPFVIRTVLIQILGAEYLGLNSLITSILQVLNLAELGFSNAVVFSMYKPIAEKDDKTICALMNLYKKTYRIIGLIIIAVGLIITPFLKFFINGSYPNDINLYLLFLLYLINTSFTYFFFAYKGAILIANQRTDLTLNSLTITSLIQYVLQILILVITKNYYYFVVANIVTTALNNIIVAIQANKHYPQYICKGKIENDVKKEIKKKISGLMIQRICTTTRNSLDSICISAFLGLSMVAMYNNYYTIMNSVVAMMSIFGVSILSSVGNSIAVETVEKNYNDMRKFNFTYMWISGWCTVCLIVLFQPFMKIWMGENLLLSYDIVILLAIYFYILKMGDIRATYSDAKGLWWENKYRAIIESIANLVLNIVLGKFFGIRGIILATILSLFFINFIYGSNILFIYYFKQVSVKKYFKDHLVYFLCTIVAVLSTLAVCHFIQLTGILELICKAIICIVIPNIVYVVLYKNTILYKESKEFILKILKRRE